MKPPWRSADITDAIRGYSTRQGSVAGSGSADVMARLAHPRSVFAVVIENETTLPQVVGWPIADLVGTATVFSKTGEDRFEYVGDMKIVLQ